MDPQELIRRLQAVREAHDSIISGVEPARARVRSVEALREQLSDASDEREELLRMAIGCVEDGYYRPAMVMAWSAVVDRMLEILAMDDFERLRAARPKWEVRSRDQLAETYREAQFIDAVAATGLIRRSLQKTLQGQLHLRNQAAHAGPYRPTFNLALGYVESVVSSLKDLDAVD